MAALIEKVLPGGIYKDLILSGSGVEDDAFEVPAERVVEILYGRFVYQASADVGDRKITIDILNAADDTVLPLFVITLAATERKVVAFGISLPATFPGADDILHLPSRFLMDALMSFDISITGGFADDAWALTAKYVEWID